MQRDLFIMVWDLRLESRISKYFSPKNIFYDIHRNMTGVEDSLEKRKKIENVWELKGSKQRDKLW